MDPFQFYIPGLKNYPSYSEQKEFLKYYEGNFKWFNLSSQIRTWTGLDRTWDTFWAKTYNRSSIVLNQKSFGQKKIEIVAQGRKCQNGYLARKITTLPLLFLCMDFKIVFDQLQVFAQKVSQALSRPVHVFIQEDKLNYLKFPS